MPNKKSTTMQSNAVIKATPQRPFLGTRSPQLRSAVDLVLVFGLITCCGIGVVCGEGALLPSMPEICCRFEPDSSVPAQNGQRLRKPPQSRLKPFGQHVAVAQPQLRYPRCFCER